MNSKGEIIMKKLKKCLSLCLVILTIILSVVSVGATISKKSDPTKNYSSSILYAGGKYILANESGIFVTTSPTSKWKKITSKYRGDGKLFISDGKTIYFATTSPGDPSQYRYSIYSIKTSGKGLKKIKSGKGPVELIACYNGNLYYGTAPVGSLYCTKMMKINLKSKKVKCVSGNHPAGVYSYLNGRIYFSELLVTVSEETRRTVYCLNLKTGKIKKVLNLCSAHNMSKSTNSIAILSNKYGSSAGTTNNYIYTINSKHKITRSKKLPNNACLEFISKDNKYAYYRIINSSRTGSTYYRFNLKTGKKEKIKGTGGRLAFDIIGDCKSSGIYFIANDSIESYTNKIRVYKLSGTKLISQKIGNNKYKILRTVSINGRWTHGNYWARGNTLITTEKGIIKTYKLS